MGHETIRAADTFKRLRNAARDAARAAHALQALDVDVYGRYVVDAEEVLDEDEVLEFLRLARDIHPRQELTITVTASTAQTRRNGNGTAAAAEHERAGGSR